LSDDDSELSRMLKTMTMREKNEVISMILQLLFEQSTSVSDQATIA
jgi:hypothetical protein